MGVKVFSQLQHFYYGHNYKCFNISLNCKAQTSTIEYKQSRYIIQTWVDKEFFKLCFKYHKQRQNV